MNDWFETGKKARGKPRPGLLVRGLRTAFNVALILGASTAIGVAGLYLFVVEQYGDDLARPRPELVQDSYVYDARGRESARSGPRRAARPSALKAWGIACRRPSSP